jgi:hypothetical protein
MAVVNVTIDDDGGKFTTLVMNTREDLLHDYRFFIGMAKRIAADDPEVMFVHQRFLRAALLALFAYAEAVVNGWMRESLEQKKIGFLFKRLQWDCLDKKIEFLNDASSAGVAKPKINDAKSVRNLFVHFTPGRDSEAFDKLTLKVVEDAATDLDRWLEQMESRLNLKRHPNSRDLIAAFNELGSTTQESSSDASK